jgi:hypothetical protein
VVGSEDWSCLGQAKYCEGHKSAILTGKNEKKAESCGKEIFLVARELFG